MSRDNPYDCSTPRAGHGGATEDRLRARLSQAERERDDALARESLWKRCLIKLSLSSSFEEWQEDDPEGFAKFDRIMHDGADGDDIDLDALCTTLNVEVGDD